MTTFEEMLLAILELNAVTLGSVDVQLLLEERNKAVGIPGARVKLAWYNSKTNAFTHEEIIVPSMLEFDKRVQEYAALCQAANPQYEDQPYFRKISIEKILFEHRGIK